ncbi:uncharacterized protein [Palaemon carinicauda]|uniref:uncharacterized protein n=1 Tax=Palaemon carinicauda TaxID=392227 RepID=UPI0035B61DCD
MEGKILLMALVVIGAISATAAMSPYRRHQGNHTCPEFPVERHHKGDKESHSFDSYELGENSSDESDEHSRETGPGFQVCPGFCRDECLSGEKKRGRCNPYVACVCCINGN